MKTEKNILIAFLLNLVFSIFELFGGIFTRSVAIMSDAIHDFGDALSIGVSYFLERKSKKVADDKYTYGYVRYSVLGAVLTNTILIVGAVIVIYNAVMRILNPIKINYDSMIFFAIIGVIVNFIASFVTRKGNSLNQKAVNLHMLEDVLGWVIVLIGAIIMKFTDIVLIDSIMSILVALYIVSHAGENFEAIVNIFLEKIPNNISIDKIKEELLKIEGIIDVHHIHVWSMDGYSNYATMHVVTNSKGKKLKDNIREELVKLNISHVTLELETESECCKESKCDINYHKQ